LLAFKRHAGRVLATICLAGMGVFWLPAAISLVPRHNIQVEPAGYLCVLLYFFVVGFALLYPKPLRFGWATYAAIICITLGMSGWSYFQRFFSGEYAYPTIESFIWQPGGSTLVILHNDFPGSRQIVDDGTKELLAKNGIHGTLEFRCAN